MPLCQDTQTGRCCINGVCSSRKRCKCVCLAGSFAAGQACVNGSCIIPTAPYGCLVTDYCKCTDSIGGFEGTWYGTSATCDCRVVPNACSLRLCQTCNTTTGACVSSCPAPRQCCAGANNANSAICCPEDQYCLGNGTCADKCQVGRVYCRRSLNPYIWDCCLPGQDCCPSGCKDPATTHTVTVDVSVNQWVQGPPVTAGQYITITATASGGANNNPGTTVSWSGWGSESTPAGVGLCCDGCNVDATLSHMLLLGRIGGGALFSVGTSLAFDAAASGFLEFRQNDTCVNDNQGAYTVTVTIRGCNPAAGASLGEAIVYTPTAVEAGRPAPPPGGPGTELKALLRYFWIVPTPNCSCNARAALMDEMEAREPGWCEANIETVLEWLKDQAAERKLPFLRSAAKLLVKRAISNAKRKSAARGNNK